MSKTPRQPNRIAEYSSESSFYPRELVEKDGILKLVKEDGTTIDLNKTANTTIKDASGSSIGTVNPKSGGNITIPDATNTKRGLVKLSNETPSAPANTAAIGDSTEAARADHIHPVQTTISGNAGTATKLATAKTINVEGTGVTAIGASFDGSSNATIKITAIAATLVTGLAAVATSGAYSDLTGKPAIPTASTSIPKVASGSGNAGLTSTTTYSKSDHVHPVQTTISGNAGTATKLATARTISLNGGATGSGSFDGSSNSTINVTAIDGSKITGTIPLSSIPKGAQERLIPVSDDAARLALTSNDAQNGDVIKVSSTGIMYYIVDDAKLGTTSVENAFSVFTAGAASSVDWTGITNKPTFATVATSGAYSDLSGTPVLSKVATSGAYSDLSGTPTIPTASTTNPLAAGTASYGSGTAYARSNHVHPAQTTISGNAGSATKLATAKTISLSGVTATGAPFDGSSNISIEVTAVPATLVTGLAAVATSGAYSDLTGKPVTGTASTLGLTKLYTSTGTGTDGTMTRTAITNALDSKAASSHTHDAGTVDTAGFTKLYTSTGTNTDGTMTQSAINTALNGKASSSHTHSTGSATALGLTKLYTSTGSNVDGTITQSALTSLLNNKAASSHTHGIGTADMAGFTKLYTSTGTGTDGTMTRTAITNAIPKASTADPKIAGTASPGTAGTGYAYGDHVHPAQTTISGNAGTATKLATARTINGVSFNGTTNITIKANPTVTNLTTEDLNTLTTAGFYYAASSNTCTNKPASVSGFGLIVYDTDEYGQILTAGNGLMYTRTGDEDAWNAWTPIYTGTNPSPHTNIATSTDTTSSTAPSAGGTFTAIDSVTRDSNGHVTKVNTKTITVPSNAKCGYGYGTCSTAASTTAKVASVSNYALTTGGYVTIRFTYAVPASATLNVNSTGAKSIYNNGSVIKAGVINAGDTATFIYNGSYYYLVSTSTPSRTYTANVTTTWSGSEAPYTQSITVSGMTANDNPVVDVVPDSTYATATSQIAEYGKIYKITTSSNSITVYATEKTETAVPIQLKCVR